LGSSSALFFEVNSHEYWTSTCILIFIFWQCRNALMFPMAVLCFCWKNCRVFLEEL
jgi:hypothetical protein